MHPVKWFVSTFLVVASLALPSLASAQTADIVGRVTDNSGGSCPAPPSRSKTSVPGTFVPP